MITGDVKNIKLARKYSNALLESALDNNKLDKVFNDLVFIVETIETNNQLKDFLNSPVIKLEDKKDVLAKLFSVHTDKITLDFLKVLADSGRLDVIHEILNQFSKAYNNENNIVKPNIISAVELNDVQKTIIIEKLELKLQKKVVPQYVVDNDIIGGLIVEIEDKTIDCSLKTKFNNMKKQLTKGSRYDSD